MKLPTFIGFAAVLCGIFQFAATCRGQRFEAEGSISYLVENPRLARTVKSVRRFSVLRDGVRWRITSENPERAASPDPFVSYEEYGFDGANMFYLEQRDPAELMLITDPNVFAAPYFCKALGRVSNDMAPPMDMNLIAAAWLAFASTPYIAGITNGRAFAPLFSYGATLPRLELPLKWKNHGGGSDFVEEVSWFSDGTYTVLGPDSKPVVKQYPEPYADGFLQASFRNLTWTNFGKTALPASFALVAYVPGTNLQSATLEVAFSVTGNLERVWAPSKSSFAPQLTTRTHVTDSRHGPARGSYQGEDHPISYVASNRWLISDAEVRNYLMAKGEIVDPPAKSRLWVVAPFLGACLAFAVLALRSFLRMSRKQTT
jgi:hypothetical protein